MWPVATVVAWSVCVSVGYDCKMAEPIGVPFGYRDLGAKELCIRWWGQIPQVKGQFLESVLPLALL